MDFKGRRHNLLASLAAKGIENILIQNPDSIYYLSGFNAAVSTRPFGLLLSPAKQVLFTPTTAADAVSEEAPDMEVAPYYEHPHGQGISLSFYEAIKKVLTSGIDSKVLGVEAARMSVADQQVLNSLGFTVADISGHLMRMRSIKEPEELAAIRVAAKYVDFINSETLKAVRPGITEIELAQEGSFALYQQVSCDMPSAEVSAFTLTTFGADRTVLPHTNTSMRKLGQRDFMILCRQVSINVYRAQADRMGFLGQPSEEQKRYYGIVMNAHSAAMEIIRPGIRVADIDKKIREVYEKEGLAQYFVHRSGSGIGVGMAEPPYIRFDSEETAEPNMALIIQPAIYVPGAGGFRCTDTVIITETGMEPITKHPRNIEALTV